VTEREFGDAYARWLPGLRAYVYRVIGDAADADDIVQEAFLRMLRVSLERSDEERWRRYLYRVASNLIVDRWRRRKFEQNFEAMQDPASPQPHFEEDAAVAQIFAELKPRERALLWLAYVEGESHEEISASLGVAPRGVRVMLFRARRHLRDLLQARGVLRKS
jgi:RNA polymerase sigma-70 factor (ECF subfamily)